MKFPILSTILLIFCALLSGCQKPASVSLGEPGNSTKQTSEDPPIGTLLEGEPLTLVPVEADDAVWGDPHAKVTLVAFLDFECRFCRDGFATIGQLQKEYRPEQLRVVFKHLPLESHEMAVPAAVVGQVVRQREGSEPFFAFAQTVFDHQSDLSFDNLASWAEASGVDRAAYNAGVSDRTTLERIIQDVTVAARAGAEATPTFFVNGEVIAGAQPIEVFKAAIDTELDRMNRAPGSWASAYRSRVAENMQKSLVSSLLEQDPYDYLVPIDGSPVFGPADAPVTMVMFSDFECPFCKRAEATLEQLERKYEGDMRVVFKHLPLPFHERALPAARLGAAVALHSGDRAFFELSREMFQKSPVLSHSVLVDLGKKYGLSKQELDEALEGHDPAVNARLARDALAAEDVGARGTPHFFINGKRLDGARPIEQFTALIDHELLRARDLMKKGVAQKDIYPTLQKEARAPGAPQPITWQQPEPGGRPTRGDRNAPVVIHLFSDFECPYCRMAEQHLVELTERYPKTVRVVWHDLPLPFHERALPLARAAQAAYRLGGDALFWQIHDRIFALEKDDPMLGEDELARTFKELHVDWSKIQMLMKSAETNLAIEEDRELAESLGITGTPAMIIGNYLVKGARPVDHLARAVEMALHPSETPVPSTRPGSNAD